MEYIAAKDVWCDEAKLPMAVHAFVCRKNGQIFMIVNSALSDEAKKEAIEHELDHIEENDLYSEEDATLIEEKRNVHKKAPKR